MQTRWIMFLSAVVFLVHGVIFLFAPDVPQIVFGYGRGICPTLGPQLLGAALIGLGMMNWTARDMKIGGIYGRPIVVGNLTHALVGFLVTFRLNLRGYGNEYFWLEILLYLLLTLVFGAMLMGNPVQTEAKS